jgi:oxygen-independent coproporphyrinogen III oxidase
VISSNYNKGSAFKFERLPYINYYRYPPIQHTVDEVSFSADMLSILEPLPNEQLFTIFISIPYCRVKCHSCPFFKQLLSARADGREILEAYLKALTMELTGYGSSARFSSARCGAVYLGGGTASLLEADQVRRLVQAIKNHFNLEDDAEITLEGNPREFTSEYLKEVRACGVNRVSVGLQSFQPPVLNTILNSPHEGNESWRVAADVMATGFDTVNIDLLYRLPGQTFEQWRYDVRTVLTFQPDSITMNEYVVHNGSASQKLIDRGTLRQQADLSTGHRWYSWARLVLETSGYLEFRKGSFAKAGHEQKYATLTYGKGCEMIGLGAGAYSFINGYQFMAPENPDAYCEAVREGQFPVVSRVSTRATMQNLMERFIIFSFFTSSLCRADFKQRFGIDPLKAFPETFLKLEQSGLLLIEENDIKLTALGNEWKENVRYEFYDPSLKFDHSTHSESID